MISDACMFLVRDKTSNLISTAFLKLHFQSAWQHPAINTMSSLSWHWFCSPEEGECVGWTNREREGGGGRRWREMEILLSCVSSTTQRKCSAWRPVHTEPSHIWPGRKNRQGGISLRDKHWIITAVILSLTHYGFSPRDFFSPLW